LVSPAFFTDFGNASYLYIDFPAWERLEKIGYLANCPIYLHALGTYKNLMHFGRKIDLSIAF
jgi:DMSO/TMAO reductase YedYZ heme-binding membrane subunit